MANIVKIKIKINVSPEEIKNFKPFQPSLVRANFRLVLSFSVV